MAGDDPKGLAELLWASFTAVGSVLLPRGRGVRGPHSRAAAATFLQAFTEAGWKLRQILVWSKDSLVLGRGAL
jgi:hypothetical protein